MKVACTSIAAFLFIRNKINRGVKNIPRALPRTAFAREDATLPFESAVRITHIFTVVGKAAVTKIPSINKLSSLLPEKSRTKRFKNPIRPRVQIGHATKLRV